MKPTFKGMGRFFVTPLDERWTAPTATLPYANRYVPIKRRKARPLDDNVTAGAWLHSSLNPQTGSSNVIVFVPWIGPFPLPGTVVNTVTPRPDAPAYCLVPPVIV